MLSTLKPFRLFLGCSVFVAGLSLFLNTGGSMFAAILCLLILVAGLPHGAFDYYLLTANFTGPKLVGALAVYLVLIGITILLWWLLPLTFLMSFLAYSAFHFGDSDWPAQVILRKWSWGCAVVGLPCLLSPQIVASLFTTITGLDNLAQATAVLGWIAVPATVYCCLPTSGVGRDNIQPSAKGEHSLMPVLLLSYSAVCTIAGPLAAFACYFACMHGPFHLKRWRNRTASGSLNAVFALTVSVLVCLVALLWFFPVTSGQTTEYVIEQSAIRYTFVALAALTVPHMTLLFRLQRVAQP